MSNRDSDSVWSEELVAHCRDCGVKLGAGYLCDACDTVEGWP